MHRQMMVHQHVAGLERVARKRSSVSSDISMATPTAVPSGYLLGSPRGRGRQSISRAPRPTRRELAISCPFRMARAFGLWQPLRRGWRRLEGGLETPQRLSDRSVAEIVKKRWRRRALIQQCSQVIAYGPAL
jgi:hypothetical protein